MSTGERAVAEFPGIAIGAVMNADAIELINAGNVGHFIDHAGGDQDLACRERRAIH